MKPALCIFRVMAVIAFQILAVSNLAAQQYPVKPITMIVPFAAGGPLDALARILVVAMGRQLKQTIVIENVGGAGGTIGTTRAARASPDGYTLLIHHIGMATSAVLYRKLDYNPLTDFEYIGEIGVAPTALLARRDFPSKDFKEFIAYVKANREKLTFANTGPGGASHLCSLQIMNAIQTDVTTVPYKSTGLAINDLLGGRVDFMCDSVSTAAPRIKAGQVKAYGVTGRTRARVLPDVPTLEEQGLQGFEHVTWNAVYGPKKLPQPVLARLVEALQASLRDPDFRNELARLHYEPASQEAASPAGLAARLKAEIDKWGPIVRKAAIYAD